jgi:hypothetical protein
MLNHHIIEDDQWIINLVPLVRALFDQEAQLPTWTLRLARIEPNKLVIQMQTGDSISPPITSTLQKQKQYEDHRIGCLEWRPHWRNRDLYDK